MTRRRDTDAAAVLGLDGPFAERVAGFAPRAGQRELAAEIEAALDDRETLVAEAGTGIGKTFAYLVPVLRSGRRVILSTGTKTLQDQLYHRDLPRVRDVLGARVDCSQLKGRANYLCLYRMEGARRGGMFANADDQDALERIAAWSGRTNNGDVGELADLPEDSPVWAQVTSTADNCLGQDCPYFDDCFVVRARRRAQEAQVVVVNHHLLFADLAIKQEGFGEVLPGAEAFVLDEAHQVPDIATRFFSMTVSARQLRDLSRDVRQEAGAVSAALSGLQPHCDAVDEAVTRLRQAFSRTPERGPWPPPQASEAVAADAERLSEALEGLHEELVAAAERSRGLEGCRRRAEAARDRLAAIRAGDDGEAVHWYELRGRGFSLNATPLDIAGPLRGYRERAGAAWVFTSATLTVGGSFAHFNSQLGLDEPRSVALESPFDYQRNALLYRPPGLPEPRAADYTERVVEASLPVLRAARGRAFVLFTSHRALRVAAARLRESLEYPLLVQGEAPRAWLLERFRALGNAVLLGAASFWEGVDVAGPELSCVIIDKLPFAAPDDPVLDAKLRALREAGDNPFMAHQLPRAVIALKQGAGRLIRGDDDRGVLVVCDPRLTTRPYGRIFLASLPPMRRSEDLEEVTTFLESVPAAAGVASGERR